LASETSSDYYIPRYGLTLEAPLLSMGGMVVEDKEKLEALGFTIDPRGISGPCMLRQ